jgi:hypothetical protein
MGRRYGATGRNARAMPVSGRPFLCAEGRGKVSGVGSGEGVGCQVSDVGKVSGVGWQVSEGERAVGD